MTLFFFFFKWMTAVLIENFFSVLFLFDQGLIIVCMCHERSACVSTKENNIFKVNLQIKFSRTALIPKML